MKSFLLYFFVCCACTLVLSGFAFAVVLHMPLDPAVQDRLQSLLASK